MKKDAFFTRKTANEGKKIPLFTPAGEPTEHWLQVRGIDSDAFRAAATARQRKILDATSTAASKDEVTAAIVSTHFEQVAALVAAWSFDEPCTPENVTAFLREAPQIADQIDQVASKRGFFYAASSAPSSTTQEPSSS